MRALQVLLLTGFVIAACLFYVLQLITQTPGRVVISNLTSQMPSGSTPLRLGYCKSVLKPKLYKTSVPLPAGLSYSRSSADLTQPFQMAGVDSSTGAWLWTESYAQGGYKLDIELAHAIGLIVSDSLYDFGAGKALFSCYISLMKKQPFAYAFDGSPTAAKYTNNNVHTLNLAQEFSLPPVKWVLCLEVGEHIPAKYEDIFVSNLARHTTHGLIVSWDSSENGKLDDCGGHGHVNCKSESWVISKMYNNGLLFNFQLTQKLRQSVGQYIWYKENILVFIREV